jgi:ribosomal protein S18 acetylase RimI-like enzyme
MPLSSPANKQFPTASVRRAAISDAAEIARLSAQFGHPARVPDLAARIAVLHEMPSQYLAVAEVPDATLLGWIQVERRLVLVTGDRAEIVGLVVDAAARRCGVGTLLANAAQQWAHAAKLGQMVVRSNVVRDASHEFYVALGYSRAKTQHIYVKSLPP